MDPRPTTSGTSPAPARRVWAEDEFWEVREVAAPPFDRRGGTHLIFECPTTMRRVRNFPPNWRDLADAVLYDLSLHLERRDSDA